MVELVKRRVLIKEEKKIRIGNERIEERKEVWKKRIELLIRNIEIIEIIENKWRIEERIEIKMIEERIVKRMRKMMEIKRKKGWKLDDVDIGKKKRRKFKDKIVEKRLRIGIGRIIGGSERRKENEKF